MFKKLSKASLSFGGENMMMEYHIDITVFPRSTALYIDMSSYVAHIVCTSILQRERARLSLHKTVDKNTRYRHIRLCLELLFRKNSLVVQLTYPVCSSLSTRIISNTSSHYVIIVINVLIRLPKTN